MSPFVQKTFCNFFSNFANQLLAVTSFISLNAVFIESLEVGQLSLARAEIGISHVNSLPAVISASVICQISVFI